MSENFDSRISDEHDFPLRLDSLDVDEGALSIELDGLARELGALSGEAWEPLSND